MDKNSFLVAPLLGAVLLGAFGAAPVMAEDFHVLSALPAIPAAMKDYQLSFVEGGTLRCDLAHRGQGLGTRIGFPSAFRLISSNAGPRGPASAPNTGARL